MNGSLLLELPKTGSGGVWVVQSLERQTVDFGSGHDPRVMRSSPVSGSTLKMEPAWDSLSLSLSLSLSNKILKKL